MDELELEPPKKTKKYLKIIRMVILLLIFLVVCWYSYAWWYFSQASQYEDWSEGFAISKKDGKHGYVNEKLRLVIRHSFDVAHPFADGRAITGMSYGEKYRYRLINQQGNYVGESYDEIRQLGQGLYKVRNDKGNHPPKAESDYAWYLMNHQGQIISKKPYTLIDPFVEDRTRVCLKDQCGFMDTSGRIVTPLGSVPNKDRYQQVYNFSGYGAENRLENGQHFSDGLARVYRNGKVGFIDKQNKLVIKAQFLDAENFNEKLAVVLTKSGYGVIDTQGNFVLKPNEYFEKINSFYERRAVFTKNGYQGVIDPQGNIIVDIDRQYTYISNFKHGAAMIKKYGQNGFIDTTGKEIIPPIYQDLNGDFADGTVFAINVDNAEMIVLNKNHEIVEKRKLTVW